MAAVLLLLATSGVASLVHIAGWPREQVLMTAILVGTVLLWVAEALPLFATAFIAVTLELLLLGNPGGWGWLGSERGDAEKLTRFLASAADPVLLLFLSGLVLSRATTKTGLDRRLAALVLRPLADTPARLLLGVMLATSVFSLWMSNTATTALMLALIAPILIQLPAGHRFRIDPRRAGVSQASPPNALAISLSARRIAVAARLSGRATIRTRSLGRPGCVDDRERGTAGDYKE